MKFTRRPRSRPAPGAAPPEAGAERAVRDAEQVVRRVWELELLRLRDHLHLAVRAARQGYDTARQRLAEAQRDGDPKAIGAAHAALQQALETTRTSALAHARLRDTLRAELDLLSRAARQPAAAPLAAQPAQDGSAITTEPRQTPDPPRGEPRRRLTPPQRRGRLRLSLRKLRLRWSSGLDQP